MAVKVIQETQDYVLQTGISTAEPHANVYQLINRVYDIVEVETNLLPQAYEYLEQLQSALDAKRDMDKEMKEVANTPVVQFPH